MGPRFSRLPPAYNDKIEGVYVPDNNWSNAVQTSITDGQNQAMYRISMDTPGLKDPAVGLNKNFTATYKCGDSNTLKAVPDVYAEANGTTVTFDCTKEAEKCSGFRLTLNDNGTLTLTDSSGTKIGTDMGTPIPKDAAKIQAYTAVEGKYKRNFLLGGEILALNEWIGSPKGTCRLIFEDDGSGKKALRIKYEMSGCSTAFPLDDVSMEVYNISDLKRTNNVGKVGYVNELGQLRPYPSTMLTFVNAYDKIDGYNVIGEDITVTGAAPTTAEACKQACTNYNLNSTPKCAGVVFNTKTNECKLKSEAIYNKPRIKDSHYQYYVRRKGVMPDASCPQEVKSVESSVWDAFSSARITGYAGAKYTGLGKPMTVKDKCGMAKKIEAEVKAVETQKYKFEKVSNAWKGKVDGLNRKYQKIFPKIKKQSEALASEFRQFMNDNQNMDLTGDQLKQLQAMTEDQDLHMMSENYKHILWSILAIIIIMSVIKFTKTMAAAPT